MIMIMSRDHPRGCGEKAHATSIANFKAGSPPRVRGEAVDIVDEDGNWGITPAGAGRSLALGKLIEPIQGSPPRVRGEGVKAPCTDVIHRITPAGAGRRSYAALPWLHL